MKKISLLPVVAVASLLVLLSACSKKPVMDEAPAPPAAVSEVKAAPEVKETASATLTTTAGDRLEAVYFDYDSAALSAVAQQSLKHNAELLKQEAALAVTIEGHCDERGSDEYNLALGAQRADAVKNFLVTLGVGAERLKAISYGEERPAVVGSDESAWAKNRRAAFN